MIRADQKERPKILFVANVAKEHINKFHIPTIKMLIDKGWEVDVACKMDAEVKFCTESYDLPISRSPFHTHWIKAYNKLKKIIEDGNYDIIYCHTSVGTTLARLASKKVRKKGTKVLNFAHGTYFYKNAPWYNWLYFPLYKYLAKHTDGIITITKEDYQFSQKHFSNAQIFMVNGIGFDTSRFNTKFDKNKRDELRRILNIPSGASVLIYCAELIKNKNQQLLLNALKIALKRKKDIYLILAGIDHYNGTYQKLSEDLGISTHVRFLGWRSDIADLYRISDICVASSIREGFGLNLVEAMYCGLPVIASNNSGHNSIIENGKDGFLIELNKPKEFAEKVLLLCNDESLRMQFVKNANMKINKYASSEIVKNLYDIFQQIIS